MPYDPEIDIRCSEDDPERCEGISAFGQCRFKAVPGTTFCRIHGGHHQHRSNAQAAEREYIAAKWRAQVGEFAESADIKSLRTEIGILRLLMIKQLNSCLTDNDLLMRSSSISELALKLERVVTACDRLDNRLGKTLDKTQLLIFGQQIITLVANYITSPDLIREFAGKLVEMIEDAGDPTKQPEPDPVRRSAC